MSKLLVSWNNSSTCTECNHQLQRDFTNTFLYIWIGYFLYPTIDPYPVWCWLSNLLFIFVSWQVFRFTCEECIFECKWDFIKLTFYTVAASYIYPYLEHWPGFWWIFHIFFMYCMGDIFYLIIHQKSPLVPALMVIAWKLFHALSNEDSSDFHIWEQTQGNEISLCHHHGERWFLKSGKVASMKRGKPRKDEREKGRPVLKKEKSDITLLKDENCGAQLKKEITKKEENQKSLIELTEKLKKWEEIFDEWTSLRAKEMANLTSEESKLEEQLSSICRRRQRIREDITRLELENKGLAKNIVESEANRNKLKKKRHKIEARTEEKLYEQKIEKAKLLDAIQKVKIELSRDEDKDKVAKENDSIKSTKDNTDLKAVQTNQLVKEIEEKERDLECPVCFELCVRPIFMCDFSHHICNQCRPKMTSCPQCREPYKKHKMRHNEKEMTSDRLKILYKRMKELLESE